MTYIIVFRGLFDRSLGIHELYFHCVLRMHIPRHAQHTETRTKREKKWMKERTTEKPRTQIDAERKYQVLRVHVFQFRLITRGAQRPATYRLRSKNKPDSVGKKIIFFFCFLMLFQCF